MKKLMFISRNPAENLTGNWGNWAMISITNPDETYVKFLALFKDKLHPRFTDAASHHEMTDADAMKIIEFCYGVDLDSLDGLVIHCTDGTSRSSAVARWVSLNFLIPFSYKYERYNRHVFNLLQVTGNEYK